MPGDRFLELAVDQDRHVLDVLFRHAREAVTVQDRAGGIIYANDQAAELVGMSSGRAMMSASSSEIAARYELVDERGDPLPLSVLPGRRLLAGEEATELTVGYRTVDNPAVRWSRINASPIKNDAGETVWVINFALDITEQVRRREREKILEEVTEALSGALAVRPSLKSLADILVPGLASWCGFHLLDEFDYLQESGVAFPETRDARMLFEIADPGKIAIDSDQMQARVLASGSPEFIPEISDEVLAAAEPRVGTELIDLVRRLDLGSILCMPLGVAGVLMGTVTLMRTRVEGPFDDDDLALLREIATRAGVSLVNASLFEREHRIAEALRRGLKPDAIPEVPGVQIAAQYRPLARLGHVGGDFYDVVMVDNDNLVVLIGDIEGKGLEAAAAVGMARQTIKTTIAIERDPATVLAQLNRSLRDDPQPRMCTLAYVSLRRDGDEFDATIALAGHPPPMIRRADGTIEPVGEPCPPAGVFDTVEPKPAPFRLRPGDTLVAYTDGFTNRDQTSPETVTHFLERNTDEHPTDLLRHMIDDFTVEFPAPHDDIALLALRVE